MIAKKTTIRPMTAVRPPVDSKKLCNTNRIYSHISQDSFYNTPPDLPGPDPVSQSQKSQNANFGMRSDFQAPRQSEPAPIPDPAF